MCPSLSFASRRHERICVTTHACKSNMSVAVLSSNLIIIASLTSLDTYICICNCKTIARFVIFVRQATPGILTQTLTLHRLDIEFCLRRFPSRWPGEPYGFLDQKSDPKIPYFTRFIGLIFAKIVCRLYLLFELHLTQNDKQFILCVNCSVGWF